MGDLPEDPNPGHLTAFYKGFNGTCASGWTEALVGQLCLLAMAGVDSSGCLVPQRHPAASYKRPSPAWPPLLPTPVSPPARSSSCSMPVYTPG
jgi:hypothetical protein